MCSMFIKRIIPAALPAANVLCSSISGACLNTMPYEFSITNNDKSQHMLSNLELLTHSHSALSYHRFCAYNRDIMLAMIHHVIDRR